MATHIFCSMSEFVFVTDKMLQLYNDNPKLLNIMLLEVTLLQLVENTNRGRKHIFCQVF